MEVTYDASVILYVFSCHIEGNMRCIHLVWAKYDVTGGLKVKRTAPPLLWSGRVLAAVQLRLHSLSGKLESRI